MTNSAHNEEQLDEIIEAYLLYLEGTGPEPDTSALTSELRTEADARIALLRASWGALVEPVRDLSDDPVARRFGFDRSGQMFDIAGSRLRRARQARSMQLAELARAVKATGGQTTTGALFGIEQAVASPVPQALASALAAVLDCSVEDLEPTAPAQSSAAQSFLDSPGFEEMISRWAAEHGRDENDVRRVVAPQLLAAAARAEDVSFEHWKEILGAILDGMEA